MVNKFTALITALALAGCATSYNAQQAQRSVMPKANGVMESRSTLDLRGYSLAELVDYAITNRPSMRTAALSVEDARLALRAIAADAPLVSYSPFTSPHVSASAGHNASSVRSDHLKGRTDGSASAGLSLELLVYDFGRNQAQAEAQVEKVIAAERALAETGFAVFQDVCTSYFTLMERDALLEVAQTNEAEYAMHLRQAEERLAAGDAQKLDVTRARLDLSQAREATIVASNKVVTGGAELMKALGVDVTRGTRDAVLPPNGRALSELERGFAETAFNLDEAFWFARTNSPSVVAARAKLRSAVHTVDYTIADLMPSISADVSLSWTDPLWMWGWGVNLAQTVLDGGKKLNAVNRAVVSMRSAESAVDEAEQQLSLDLETAIAVRDNAARERETAMASVTAARENLDTVKEKYREGDASRVDFTDSVSDYATALGSRVTAFYAGQIAEAKLFSLMGRLPVYREETVKEK